MCWRVNMWLHASNGKEWTPRMERLSFDFLPAVRNIKCALEVVCGCVCVCEICNHRLVLGENFMTLHFEVGASNEKPCLWWSVNFGCGNLTCTEEVWGWGNYLLSTGFMCSLDSNSGGGGDWGGGGDRWNCMYLFGGIVVGKFKCSKIERRNSL